MLRPARSQVSVTLAAVGKPGIDKKDALGYELGEDALEFLRTVEPPEGRPGDMEQRLMPFLSPDRKLPEKPRTRFSRAGEM